MSQGASDQGAPGMVFAGAEPIEEENLGDMFDVQEQDPLPHTPPAAAEPPPVQQPPAAEPAAKASTPAEGEAVPTPAEQPPADPAAQVQTGEEAPSAAEDPATPPADPQPDAAIPPFRLAQEAARRRKAEADLAAMQQRQYEASQAAQQPPPAIAPAQPPNVPTQQELNLDFGATPQEMFNKVLDGDMEKATELFQNMMKQTAEQTVQAVPQATQEAAPTMTAEQIQYQITQRVAQQKELDAESEVIDTLEQTYPLLNPQSDQFDAALVEEALALQNAYIQQHYTRADAMERAVVATLQLNGVGTQSPAGLNAGQQKQQASPDAIKRNLEAAAATPPQMPTGTGANPLELDVNTLTVEDLDGLPEATLARLRGDIL